MARNDAVIKFVDVSYEYNRNTKILDEANFVIRRGSKITLMGQNGAGKSTIFSLINGELAPESGQINISHNQVIATSKQIISPEELDLSVSEFFQNCFSEKIYNLAPRIDEVLEVVNLNIEHNKKVSSLSGGQQARLLLASALIQKPDILLLDEPTNNLDSEGIEHLTDFIKNYRNTCLVISHDAEFLNSFTDGVIYLDQHTKSIEQYDGNYNDVVREISIRIEKENRANSQLARKAQAKKDQANVFANKGGRMRMVAKRMRDVADEMEDSVVDTRKEDKEIRSFTIEAQSDLPTEVARIESIQLIKNNELVTRKFNYVLNKRSRVQLIGPNGIGKTSLLESLTKTNTGADNYHWIDPSVVVGYYRQDFTNLDFNQTPYQVLRQAMSKPDEQTLRSTAAGFLITADYINTEIGYLSQGQKGLVALARLALLKPGLLVMDEPTNHINFRHLPVIARAIDDYEGAMIIVSHVKDFMAEIRIDEVIDLAELADKKR